MQPGMYLGENFPGRNLFGEMSGINVWGIVRAGKYPGKTSEERCWDPMQVYRCSGYDLCHPGYIDYRETHSHTVSQTDRQTAFDYTISSASGTNNKKLCSRKEDSASVVLS